LNMSAMFQNTGLTSYPTVSTSIATNVSSFVGGTKIVNIPNVSYPKAVSAGGIFSNNTVLQTVGNIDLPEAIWTTTNFMFTGCTSLVSVGDINAPKAVGGIFNWFSQCQTIGDINTPAVTSLDNELQSAVGLQSVGIITFTGGTGSGNLPGIIGNNTVESIERINFPNGAQFTITPTSSSLTGLKHIGYVNLPIYSNISGLFQYNTALESVDTISVSNTANMGYLFRGCTNLLTIPSMDYSGNSDHSQMFSGCTSLTNVVMNNVRNPVRWDSAFYGCTGLTSLSMTFNQASSVYESLINSLIVDGCTALTSLILNGYDRGFNIRDTALDHDALVALFQSLGSIPSGQTGQRIFLTQAMYDSLTTVEREIATNKGFSLIT